MANKETTASHNTSSGGIHEMNIKVQQSISISHLPVFLSGYSVYSVHMKKDGNKKRLTDWIELPLKLKRKFIGKASLTNKKRYVEQIHKIMRTENVSQEHAEVLVDTSVVNVISVILSKEKESGLYKFFQLHNPGLASEKDVPLAWYAMEDAEKRVWQSVFDNPPETKSSEDENEKKRVRKYKIVTIPNNVETPPKSETPPNTSIVNFKFVIKEFRDENFEIPDALYESRILLHQLTDAFVSIEVMKDITLVKYLVGNCNDWSKWLSWYTEICSRDFTSLTDLQTRIIQKLKEMRLNLEGLNLTRSMWFNVVKQFVEARNRICTNRLKSSLCSLELEPSSQKFIYKNFQRTSTFTVNSTIYGHPDFVYVKNCEGELEIVKIQTINAQTERFTGYLFVIGALPGEKVHIFSKIKNFVTYIEKNYLIVFKMSDVVGKCLVLNEREYFMGRPTDLVEKDIFACTLFHKNNKTKGLTKHCCLNMLVDGLKNYWGDVYYFKHDGTEKNLGEETLTKETDDNVTKPQKIENVESGDDSDQADALIIDPMQLYDSPDEIKGEESDEDVIIID